MGKDVRVIEKEDLPEKLKCELIKPGIEKLWYRGGWSNEIIGKCVGVVGSRKMSRYGKQVLAEIIPKLCGAGYTIVSGLMYGVDQESHKLAIECGGKTIAVLGYGFGARVEEGAEKLEEQIVESGGLVISEYPAKTSPRSWMFLQRNRIVVALSEMVIVAEAAEKSGSLHTAGLAIKQGKQLYAVPGGIFSPTSVGANNLITQGQAKAMTIVELSNLSQNLKLKNQNQNLKLNNLSAGEKEILTLLEIEGPMSANEIARGTGERVGGVQGTLVQLEMRGWVNEERGVWKML